MAQQDISADKLQPLRMCANFEEAPSFSSWD